MTLAEALTLGRCCRCAGFLLGGIQIYGGDPGIGIVLVPLGGLLLLYGVGATARAVHQVRAD